jgi:hypothetical protein
LIVLAGALVTLPSMLGISEAVKLSIGQWWWTLIITVAALLMAASLRSVPLTRWRRRVATTLAVILVFYGIVLGMYGVFVATDHDLPSGDLVYLFGLPLISGIGGLVTLVTLVVLGRSRSE